MDSQNCGASSTKTSTATGSHTVTVATVTVATAVSPDLPRKQLRPGGAAAPVVPDEEQDLVGALPAMSPTSRQRKLQADKNYQREAHSLQLQSNMSVKSGLACTLESIGGKDKPPPDPEIEHNAVEDYMGAVRKMLEKRGFRRPSFERRATPPS